MIPFAASENGWITKDIFEDWIKKIFLPFLSTKRIFYKKPDQPAVLFLDGHSTRASEPIHALLKTHNVFLVTIPAHTSHVLQPLDCGVNRSFKAQLKKYITIPDDNGTSAQRLMLIEAAIRAGHQCHDPILIGRAFRASGIHPWDKQVILGDKTKVLDDRGSASSRPIRGPRGPSISGQVLVHGHHTFPAAAQFISGIPLQEPETHSGVENPLT